MGRLPRPVGLLAAVAACAVPLLLALVVQQMAVSRRRPRELGAAVGAARLGRVARLLPLVAQEVAERAELAAVAPVLPALRLGPALDDPDVAAVLGLAAGHD